MAENTQQGARKRQKSPNSRSRANRNYYQRNREALLAKANDRAKRLREAKLSRSVGAPDLTPPTAESQSPKRLSIWGSLLKSLGKTG